MAVLSKELLKMPAGIINTLPLYLSITLGYILKRKKSLPENAAHTIGFIAFNVVVPFLIFNALYGVRFTKTNFHLVSFVLVLTGVVFLALFIYTKALRLPKRVVGSVLGGGIGFAVGSFAYPFIQVNFDQTMFQTVVLLDVVHATLAITLGYFIITYYGEKSTISWTIVKRKFLLNPIMLAIAGTLLCTYLNIPVSKELLNATTFFSKTFFFLATFMIGLKLELPNFKKGTQVIGIFLTRNLAVLATVIIVAKLVHFSQLETMAATLTFLTPFATLPVVYAEEQGTDTAIISQLSVFSSVLFLFLYPGIISLVN